MKISIIHPSRSRPQQAVATAKAWLSSAKSISNITYTVVYDNDDPFVYEYRNLFFGGVKGVSSHSGVHLSAIDAINKGVETNIKHGIGFDLLIIVSDDFNTPPYHWDEALRTALAGKSDYLVKTDDGAQPWIITLPIMDRVYYNRFGYVYDPRFLHLFADTAATHVGHILDKVITLPITIKHNHYTQNGGQSKDAINVKNDATWNQGEKEYLEQLMRYFDIPIEQQINPINKVHSSHLNWLKQKGIEFTEKAL